MAFQGIDVRQTGDRIVVRALLQDSTGAILATGTTNLKIYELQNDGTLKSYDFSSNTFKTTALTTENQAMTHRTGNNSTTNTGLWTYALTTLTGFTAGNIYLFHVSNTGASPVVQTRESQYGVASAFDPYDAVRGGLTALPNAVPGAAGGLLIDDVWTDARAAKLDNLDVAVSTAVLSAAAIRTALGLASANLDTQLTAIDDYIDTEIAAIKAKTDALPSDPADASDIAASFATVNSTLATIAAYIDTEVAAIKAKTDNLPASPAAVGSAMTLTSGERTAIANEVETQIIDETDSEKVLTAITDKIAAVNPDLSGLTVAAIASAVWSAATRLLTAGTNIVLAKGTGVTGFNDLSAAQVNTEVDTALADYDGPTHAEIPTVGQIADSVWDEALAGHLGAGSTGTALNAAGSAGDPWSTALPGGYGAGSAGKIIGDNLNAPIGSRATQTSVDDVPTNAELAAALGTADDATLAQIALVKAKTDNLPSDPADASDVASAFATVNSALATIAAYIDTEVAAIKVKTDALSADPADASDIAASFVALTSTLNTALSALSTSVTNLPTTIGTKVVEGGKTRDGLLKLAAAGAAGTRQGFGTGSPEILGIDGTTVRIATTDADGQGNATIVVDTN